MYFARSVTCVAIATLACLSFVCCEKYKVCVVDGKGGFKLSTHYCPALDQPNSNVECVIGVDRLDCLRKISKGKADFSVFTPEDLVTAHYSEIEILVTNELRYTKDKFEYEVVAVVDNKAGIRSRHDLKEKRYCHPGYGYETDWTRILANFFEATVVPQICSPKLTITENRIKASSDFFKKACKAGPWVNNATLDEELKRKYPNLCSLCDTPRCSMGDKYWGRRGPLFCLTDGAGDISWARWDDVQIHFGLVPGGQEAIPTNYSLLCPNDSLMPMNTLKPCVWVVKPWPVVAAKRTVAQEIQQLISNLSSKDPYQNALLNLISAASLTVKTLQPSEPIETYLDSAPGFLSANSFSGCHPPRTIKMCTTSIIERAKCAWMRESATVYGIEPDIECIKADNTTHCMLALNSNAAADVVMVPPDKMNFAVREYKLKPLFYETVQDHEKYVTVAVTRQNSNINDLSSLKGKKACFPIQDGVAWNTALHVLHAKNLIPCASTRSMADFFGSSCVPGLKDETGLVELCDGNNYDGEYGAIHCLASGKGDVAFISQNSLNKFLIDESQNQENKYKLKDFKILCESKDEPCHLSWAPIAYGMVRANSTKLWMRDTLDVFLNLDQLFGRNYKSVTNPFTMYGKYDNRSDLLFHDITVRLRDVPTYKNTDTMIRTYEDVLKSDKPCIASSANAGFLPNYATLAIFINFIFFYVYVL